MKLNTISVLGLLASGTAAYWSKQSEDPNPIEQKSRVTAFVNTDRGLAVQCWEIGDFLPETQVARADGSKGAVHSKKMAGNIEITLFSFAPSVTIFSFGMSDVQANAIDFRAKPNLFTVKDGLIFIEALETGNSNYNAQTSSPEHHVFADVNGDDWFYFEDDSSSSDAKASDLAAHFSVRTISGSDTTLINFQYDRTPQHRVLHEGRCNFAGLKPASIGKGQSAKFKKQEV